MTSEAAAQKLCSDGPNEITRAARKPAWKVLVAQFRSALIALLFVACTVSIALGETADAIAIAVTVVVNACVGFLQEYRAERALFALRALTAPRARVVRDGHILEIPAREVVVGDLLALEAGDVIAADARLEQAHALLTAEALLTGESALVAKQTSALTREAASMVLSDDNFAWRLILFVGALQTVVVLSVFVVVLRQEELQTARNMAFTTLVFGELFRAFSARSRTRPFWRTAPLCKVFLLAVVGVSALVQIGMHQIPLTQRLFDIGGISLRDCLMSLALGLLPMLVIELWKVIRRRNPRAEARRIPAAG